MGHFSIWVEGVVPQSSGLVYGTPLCREAAGANSSDGGPTCFLAPGARLQAECRIGHAHVGSLPRLCWWLSLLPPLKPPYLVTDDPAAANIFWGEVRYEPDAQHKRFLKWQPTVPVAADSWFGVAIARRTGWLRRTYAWTLFAVSSDPQARVEPGPLHSPVHPDYSVGVLFL